MAYSVDDLDFIPTYMDMKFLKMYRTLPLDKQEKIMAEMQNIVNHNPTIQEAVKKSLTNTESHAKYKN